MSSSTLKTLNTMIDQYAGSFFHEMGLETPHLTPLAKQKEDASKNDQPISFQGFKRSEAPVANGEPKPEVKQETSKPKAKAKASAPATHVKPSAKPHRTANAGAPAQRSHGFTPANKHPTNALGNIVKSKSTTAPLHSKTPPVKSPSVSGQKAPQWLLDANKSANQPLNHEVKHKLQNIGDNLNIVRNGKENAGKTGETRVVCGQKVTLSQAYDRREAMEMAKKDMSELEAMAKDPNAKLSDHDREAIQAQRKIVDQHSKLDLGEVNDDPDIKSLKLTAHRYTNGADQLTRPPENSQLAANRAKPADKAPIPKHVDYVALAKQSRAHGHKGPKTVQTAHAGKPHGPLPKRIHPPAQTSKPG